MDYYQHMAYMNGPRWSAKDVRIMKVSRLVSLIALWVIVTALVPPLFFTAALIPWRYRRYCKKVDRRAVSPWLR